MCYFCGNVEETNLHALRDCLLVIPLWLNNVDIEARYEFFQGNLQLVLNNVDIEAILT
jgi:hypothetical protein